MTPRASMTVIGGGIGGLAASIFASSVGVGAEVYERSVDSRTAGLGINLQPYAVAALDSVGLGEKVMALGRACGRWAFFDRNGREIVSERLPERDGWPRVSISRGALASELADVAVARGCSYLSGFELVGVHDTEDQVYVDLVGPMERRTRRRARAVLGADGINSTVRRLLLGSSAAPRHAGKVLWRATTRHSPILDGNTMVIAGSSAKKIVVYPIGPNYSDGQQELNWIAEMEMPGDEGTEGWDETDSLDTVAAAYEEFEFDWLSVPEIVRKAERVLRFSMLDRDPLDRWSYGPVTLLGDAAHPMYPVGSHGASQAIRDAEALAGSLASAGSMSDAFARYEARRRPEANALVLANRDMGPDAVLDLGAATCAGAGSWRARRDAALSVLARYRELTEGVGTGGRSA